MHEHMLCIEIQPNLLRGSLRSALATNCQHALDFELQTSIATAKQVMHLHPSKMRAAQDV
jgi:hypothetical protein